MAEYDNKSKWPGTQGPLTLPHEWKAMWVDIAMGKSGEEEGYFDRRDKDIQIARRQERDQRFELH